MPSDSRRIAILGAGPIGLEAALYARTLGFKKVAVYEAGKVGEYWRRWGHVRLFSPFAMNVTPLGRKTIMSTDPQHQFPADTDCITGSEHLKAYLLPLIGTDVMADLIQTETQVVSIGRRGLLKSDGPSDVARGKKPFQLLLQDKSGERIEEADIVLDCTGTYGQPRWLGDGGIPAIGERNARQHIAYDLQDIAGKRTADYLGKTTLVVGGGYSAATAVCQLADLADEDMATWVIWAARASRTQPIKRIANDVLRERDRLAVKANTLATRDEGNVEFHPSTFIESVEYRGDEGFHVEARCGDDWKEWNPDRIIAHVGFSPNNEIYRELQVHECYASLGPMKLAAALLGEKTQDCLAQTSHGPDTLRNPEPNFYILGAKSYGRNSNFLLRIGFEQVRDVFRLITGKGNLDLYG